MSHVIPGIHHITAICGPAQANVDFYVGILGQRLVKRTVNFDDPGTYHLYYGDESGTPGSILTFFPFEGADRGEVGAGMASAFAYAVPEAGFGAVRDALTKSGIRVSETVERFGEPTFAIDDPDGLHVEFVQSGTAAAPPATPRQAGFHSVTLSIANPEKTARLLTDIFGYGEVGEEATAGEVRLRFAAAGGGRASVVDLVRPGERRHGIQGTGTVHHVAFRAETDAIQRDWRERLLEAGFHATEVIDRQYFNAIYFREPGGVLFEIATDPPGFAADEPAETMGAALMLPPRYERLRAEIEDTLPPLTVPDRAPA